MFNDKEIDDLIKQERFSENDPYFYSRLRVRTEREVVSDAKDTTVPLNMVIVSVLVVISLGLGFLFGYGVHNHISDSRSTTARQTEMMQFSSENNLSLISTTNEKILLLK